MLRLMLPLTTLVACASAPEDAAGPGPMRPLAPDSALDEAAPIALEQSVFEAWLAERVAVAQRGDRERVRLPVVRRQGCDCPSYAIAPTPIRGPFYVVALDDRTSAGIPPGAWSGWVDGRFTGQSRSFRTGGGIEVVMPVFEVHRQRRRGDDEPAEARAVRDTP